MSKTKSSTKAVKPSKSDVLTKVKSGGVTKPVKEDKSSKKELAKKVEKEEKKSKKDKKKVKEPTPEPESESSSEEEDEASSESESSESEVETKKPAVNGKANKKVAAKDESSDESDSSEDEAPAPKKAAAPKTNGAKAAAKKEDSDDSDSSESSDDEEEAAPKTTKAAAKDDSSDESESSDSDDEAEAKPKVNGSALPADAADDETDSDASDSSSEEESDEEEKPAPKANKRKAEDAAEPTTKKAKTDVLTTATGEESTQKNLFVGNLSWNIDEAWLRETFEEHGELSGCRVMYDKATQRAKGFGYVEYVKAEDAAAAYEAKKGFELDGRAINLDWASAKPNNQDAQNDRRKSYGDQLSEPTDTLFVGNLSFDVGQEQVSEAFSSYGTILSVRLPTRPEDGAPKGFGYVTFTTVEEASAALEAMQGSYLSNRPVRLDYSQPRPPRDDNAGGRGRGGFGGGFGGRGGGRGRGGFDRGGRGGGRGGSFGGRGRGAPRGGRGGSTNRGGFGDFSGQKKSFD